MRNYYKCFLLIILVILTGCCQHRIFGVPESTWRCLSASERATAIENYNVEQTIKARRNPPYCTLQRHLHNMPGCHYNPYFGH